MIDVTFELNGVDWSEKLSTYDVKYQPEEVKNIRTMDWAEHTFVAKRPHITFSLMPLTDEECVSLYSILAAQTIPVTFTDPNQSTEPTMVMRLYSNIDHAFGIRSIDGNRYYKGTKITLRSNTVV